jgi:hypothetical protein
MRKSFFNAISTYPPFYKQCLKFEDATFDKLNKSTGEEHDHQDDQKSTDNGDEGGVLVEELDVLEEHLVYAEYYERASYRAPY